MSVHTTTDVRGFRTTTSHPQEDAMSTLESAVTIAARRSMRDANGAAAADGGRRQPPTGSSWRFTGKAGSER